MNEVKELNIKIGNFVEGFTNYNLNFLNDHASLYVTNNSSIDNYRKVYDETRTKSIQEALEKMNFSNWKKSYFKDEVNVDGKHWSLAVKKGFDIQEYNGVDDYPIEFEQLIQLLDDLMNK